MGVIGAVTSEARCGSRDLGGIFCRMAGMTLQTGMCSGQRELGFLVVIEAPEREAVGVMTARASGTKPALVMLVFVTTLARPRGILVGGGAMTLLAWYRGVEADKWKPAEVVIEGDFLAPGRFIMAALAALSELAVVGIVFLVTGDAGRRQLVAV